MGMHDLAAKARELKGEESKGRNFKTVKQTKGCELCKVVVKRMEEELNDADMRGYQEVINAPSVVAQRNQCIKCVFLCKIRLHSRFTQVNAYLGELCDYMEGL
jgi:hypothetical protein